MCTQLQMERAGFRRRIREHNYHAWLFNERYKAIARTCPDSCAWRGMLHTHTHDATKLRKHLSI